MNPKIAKQNAAAVEAFLLGKPIQFKHACAESGWMDFLLACPSWSFVRYHYRPNLEPVAVRWSKPEHVPGPVCWIRYKLEDRVYLVTSIHSAGLTLADQIGADWSHMDKFEHSADRVNWHPCSYEKKA